MASSGKINGFGRRIRTGAADDRYSTIDKLDHPSNDLDMLAVIEGGRLTRGADRDDGIGAVVDVVLDQPLEGCVIDGAIGPHRRDHCYHAALKHDPLLVMKSIRYATNGPVFIATARRADPPSRLAIERPS